MTSLSAPLPREFTLSDFDFELPPELIAQHPAAVRSGSRLLDGSSAAVVDRIFNELPGLLNAGDLLVFNDTKVVKARIFGEKASGGKLELLIERVLPGHEVVGVVDALGPGATRLHVGQRVGVAWLGRTDGTCRHCRSGHENLCVAPTREEAFTDAAAARAWADHLRNVGVAAARLGRRFLGNDLNPEAVVIAAQRLRSSACACSSTAELSSGRRNSMPCAAASHSMARMRETLAIIGCSRRAAKVAMLT